MVDGPTREEQAEHARRRLDLLDALLAVLEEPHALLDLVLGAEDPESAAAAIISRYDVRPVEALAVLDLGLRRLTAQPRRDIEEQRDELRAELHRLGAL